MKTNKRSRVGLPGQDTLTYSMLRSYDRDFPECGELKMYRALINRIAEDVSIFAHWKKRGIMPNAEALNLYRDGWNWFNSTAYHSFGIICEMANLEPSAVKKHFHDMVRILELPHPDDLVAELQKNRRKRREVKHEEKTDEPSEVRHIA